MPVPTAPIFTVDGIEIGSVVLLSWSDADAGASSVDAYRVNRKVGDGNWGVIFTSDSAAITQYFDQGTAVGDVVTYTIQAHNIVGWSAVSAERSGISQGPAAGPVAAVLDSYLTLAEADGLAAALGLVNYPAKDADTRAVLLNVGTIEIDAGGPYQGRKYDLWTPQALEFPRVPYESAFAVVQSQFSSLGAWLGSGFAGVQVWDWDRVNNVAIVPASVKRATLYQADALAKGTLKKVLDGLAKGLSAQATGSLSESYRDPATLAGALVGASMGLCREAGNLMRPYRLSSGRLL